MTQTFFVKGMTCNKCAAHVQQAPLDLPGVRSAQVELTLAQATIEADANVPNESVAAALDEAGYALA
jgi:copper chaperone CopZ